ncbi:TMEM175 family protein [Methanobrevibacter sp.]|uniref:TMEM175 family protein n=1 Tax=Methanobrevibacter sp. TaxID=66852 RepID=UPI00388D761C
MKTDRFETFFDAVIAIIITVLVLKLYQPEQATWNAIWTLNTQYLTYLLCYIINF